MCSLRFGIEENTIIETFVRFRFTSVAITTPDPQLFVTKVIFTTSKQIFSCLSEERRSYILDVWSYGVLLWEIGKFNNI
jgi:hypothetical protein